MPQPSRAARAHADAMTAIKARAIEDAVHALSLPPDVCAWIVRLACHPDALRTHLAREGARRTLLYSTVHVARFSRGDVGWTFARRP